MRYLAFLILSAWLVAPVCAQPICDHGGSYHGFAGECFPVTFDGTGSSSPDGEIVSFVWEFGDGASSTGAIVEHVYGDWGTYIVTLTVTDTNGASSSCATTAYIELISDLPPPVCEFEPQSGEFVVGDVIVFDASASYNPCGGPIWWYQWNFGDGEGHSGPTPETEHVYTAAGEYLVRLVVYGDGDTACNGLLIVHEWTPITATTWARIKQTYWQ